MFEDRRTYAATREIKKGEVVYLPDIRPLPPRRRRSIVTALAIGFLLGAAAAIVSAAIHYRHHFALCVRPGGGWP